MQYFPGSYWAEIRARAEAGAPGFYQASYLRRIFHAALGHKGIYWMMPLLALASIQAITLLRTNAPVCRSRRWLALSFAALPPVAIAFTMIWAFDLSGGAYGIRHVYAAIPPLFCVMGIPAGIDWLRGNSRRSIFMICALCGALVAWIGVYEPWSHNTFSAVPPYRSASRSGMAS